MKKEKVSGVGNDRMAAPLVIANDLYQRLSTSTGSNRIKKVAVNILRELVESPLGMFDFEIKGLPDPTERVVKDIRKLKAKATVHSPNRSRRRSRTAVRLSRSEKG